MLRALPMKPSSFPAFAICGLDELIGHQGRGVTHILSILDPEWPDPVAFQAYDPHFRATLRFHDAIEPDPDILLPQRGDVAAILTFGRDAAEAGGLLIHCHAGISRSTAAIYTRQLEKRPELAEIMRRGNRAREVELGLNGKQPGPLQRAV